MDKELDIFNLTQSISHHKNILRTITSNSNGIVVSGSFDKTCAFYARQDGHYNPIKDTAYHDDYVYVVRSTVNNIGFFSGSKDAKIILMDNEGNPISEFIGHSQTVNSISQIDNDSFISGSWDTTARIWDINTGKCLFMLKDHAYAVCVLALPNKRYITGSQDKRLRFWDRDQLVKTIDNAHEDIIRDIVLSEDGNSFYSCSNDCVIKQWSMGGDLLNTLTGHEGFIFRIFVKNGFLFSAGDDKLVKVWKDNKFHQDLFHPNTIWDLTVDNEGDLLTACADGVVRVFSCKPDKWLSQQELDEYVNMCLISGNKEEESNEEVDVSKLPNISEMYGLQAKEGEIRVFNNNGNAEAYVVKGGNWEKIGDVLGTKQDKKFYPGDNVFKQGYYDFVFDVELEGRTTQIPMNKGDNCLVAAETFIARENLQKLYLDDVTKFLRTNSKEQSQPQGYKQVDKKQQPQQKKVYQPSSMKFPRTNFIIFDSVNVDGPYNKVEEFNKKLNEEDQSLTLSNTELKDLKLLLDKSTKTAYYHSSTFQVNEITALFKLNNWPHTYITPYLDIFRMFLLHPRSHEIFKKSGGGIQEYTKLINILKNGVEVQKILVLRILNNMFINESSRMFMLGKRQDVLDNVSVYLDTENKMLRSAIIALLFK